MKTHQTDFSKGNVYRNILELSIPMTLAQLLNLLYNVVDRMYIGRIPETGRIALTGVGICFPIITMIMAFTYLYGNGGSPRSVRWSLDGEMRKKQRNCWEIHSPCF